MPAMTSPAKARRQLEQSDKELRAFQRLLESSASHLEAMQDPKAALPDYWEQRRRKPRPSDKALTGDTLAWLITLPREMQPHETVDRYPRIINRIAESWNDPSAARDCFYSLLHDPRPGRKGFPSPVRRELKILRFLHATTQPAPAPKPAA